MFYLSPKPPRQWRSLSLVLGCLTVLAAGQPTANAQAVVRLAIDRTTLNAGESASVAPILVSGTLPSRDFSLTASPNIGTILRASPSAFRYTAPASIAVQTQVTLVLRIGGLADPISAVVTLNGPVSVSSTPTSTPPPPPTLSVLPSSVVVSAGSSLGFSALLNGAPTTAVTWQVSPLVGSISGSGVYTAPTSLSAPVTVQVTARWTSNSTVAAVAAITVNPVVSISISPAAHSISAGGKAQFNAVVSGTSNTGVSWRLSPVLGTILNGLYTAPTSVSAPTSVQVIATSLADPTRLAVGTVQINPLAPPSSAAIVLPIEVYGANGTTRAVNFTLSSTQLPSASRLFLQVHGLDSENEASIQINNSNWIPLNETNLQLLPLEKAYGGIGGGFNTIRGRVNLQSAWLVAGTNTIRFRFNQTDGFTHGFRILRFNVENSMAQGLLPASTFVDDNPSTWTAPLPDATSISQGRFLWYNAQLSTPLASSIRAKCSDCHAQDGRDLKYFNYSNLVIRTRAQFHGLTSTQGDQIASYIRSLNVPNPGRPWNPPYQPGPGLDSRPISEWSAGAGLSAVLDDDRDTLKAIFPYGYDASRILPTGNLSARETPVALQLPDWNHWLPQVHPKDAFPLTFEWSGWNQHYLRLRSGLQPGSVASLLSQRDVLNLWGVRRSEFLWPLRSTVKPWPESTARAQYSGLLWNMVKEWELNQEFQIEAMSRSWFGAQADDRAWLTQTSFMTSPNMIQIPRGNKGLINGRTTSHIYLAFIWYHLQLILNNSNKRQNGTSPIDWPYVYGFITELNGMSPQMGMLSLWYTKSMQLMETGLGPEVSGRGWSHRIAAIPHMAHPGVTRSTNSLPVADRNELARIFLQTWLSKARSFSPSQWYALQTKPTDVLSTTTPQYDANMPSRIFWMLQTFRTWGVDSKVLGETADWSRMMWPNIDWHNRLGL